MKIKTFSTGEYEEANAFIAGVDLIESGAVQVTSENQIVIFYNERADYKRDYLARLIQGLERNLFHEEIRLASLTMEHELALSRVGDKSPKSDEAKLAREKGKPVAQAQENINLLSIKLEAYRAQLENV